MRTWILAALALAAIIVGIWRIPQGLAPMPAASNDGPGESEDFSQRRTEWVNRLHRHAPDLDWRAQDAATRASLSAQRVAMRRSGKSTQALANVPAGVWHERGANNWAGRVSDVDYDATTDRLTVFAHGGQLWRSQRSSLNWQPLNDDRHFEPGGRMQNFLRLAGAGATPERWIAADDTQRGYFYSDNQGATWTQASGFAPGNWFETTDLVARDVGSNQVYAIVGDYNYSHSAYEARLLVSADRGASYSDLGFVGTKEHTALFALGQGSNLVYLLVGNVLNRVNTNNTLTAIATIPGTPAQAARDKIGLAGGIATGTPYLYAFYDSATTSNSTVFQSLDAGSTWAQRGAVPATTYVRVAVAASYSNPNLVFYGSVNLFRSTNGGQTFTAVNNWTEYYGNVANKLHADISFIASFPDSSNHEVFFAGTDGGLFESTDGLATVHNDNLRSMRQAQYYDSYTGRTPPYAISVGAQDQGYQRAANPASGTASFRQVISGDYAHLTSSNGGAMVWSNYPGFTQVDPAPAADGTVLPEWSFGDDGNLQNMLFLPALMADPGNPYSAWLAGGASTANVNHVIKLTWNGIVQYTGQITANEGTFDFGGQVTALGNDGGTYFAMADNASNATSFFRSTTPGSTWTKTVTTLPQGHYFYGNGIAVDPARANTIYVCGSGYSNPGVYVSIDNGTSFSQMSNGLPNTMVYSLAISPDGSKLFAATEVGPYYYDRSNANWVNIGTGAPDNTYWNVDYVPALNVARFSTYGRGLWDYDMGGGDLIFRSGLE
ncbi:MAG TPA: hypothetical protein VFN13_01585 [Rudaea sp.]|nr:hypothetical protein [Rudaea sp.]